jgi:hypothetical protein
MMHSSNNVMNEEYPGGVFPTRDGKNGLGVTGCYLDDTGAIDQVHEQLTGSAFRLAGSTIEG